MERRRRNRGHRRHVPPSNFRKLLDKVPLCSLISCQFLFSRVPPSPHFLNASYAPEVNSIAVMSAVIRKVQVIDAWEFPFMVQIRWSQRIPHILRLVYRKQIMTSLERTCKSSNQTSGYRRKDLMNQSRASKHVTYTAAT